LTDYFAVIFGKKESIESIGVNPLPSFLPNSYQTNSLHLLIIFLIVKMMKIKELLAQIIFIDF